MITDYLGTAQVTYHGAPPSLSVPPSRHSLQQTSNNRCTYMTPPCIIFSFVPMYSFLFCSSSVFSLLFIFTLEIFFRGRHLGPCCPSGNVWPPVALAVKTCRREPMLPTAITHLVSQCRGAPRTGQSACKGRLGCCDRRSWCGLGCLNRHCCPRHGPHACPGEGLAVVLLSLIHI